MDKYCALYSRVSDDIQVDRGESIPRQRDMLVEEARRLEYKRFRHFVDEGISGKDTNRPAFQKMLSEIGAGQVNCVLVYDLSRISRNEADTFNFLEHCKKNATKFGAIRGNFDLSTPEGAMLMGINAVTNSYFRKDLIRKVKDAMVKMHRDGRFTGGQPAYGFSVKDKKLIHHPEEAEVVRKMYKKFEELKSLRGVTVWLNKHKYTTKKKKSFPSTTVRRILTNSLYCGLPTFGKRPGDCDTKFQPRDKWIIAKGNFDPIISKEQFDRVQAAIHIRSYKAHPRGKFIYLLNGLLYCGRCGDKMFGTVQRQGDKAFFYYRCNSKGQRGTCKEKNFRGNDLENAVLDVIKRKVHFHFSKDEVSSIDKDDDWESELRRIDKSIVDCKGKEERLYGLFSDGAFDQQILKDKLARIANDRENLEKRRIEIINQHNPDAQMARKKVYEYLEDLNGGISAAPREKLHAIIRDVVAKIEASSDGVVNVEMYEVDVV